MRNKIGYRDVALVLLLMIFLTTIAVAMEPWHDSLYLAGGDCWRARLPVAITNDGDSALEGCPIEIEISADSPITSPLVDTPVAAIRVCDATGVEMLFGAYTNSGAPLDKGDIPSGSHLVIPVVCTPRTTVTYYIYFDNRRAGRVPDFLPGRASLINGDVEAGQGLTPTGWRHDVPDRQHRATWTDECAESGKKSLKTSVAPTADPTWIATRQSGVRITAGERYRVTAWVKARDVRGQAGWYLHIGNAENSMLAAPTLSAGEGTFDWKQVQLEFTAPPGADRLSLGTVLRGTGTAWFDNVSLEGLGGGDVRVDVLPVERLQLHDDDTAPDPRDWPPGWPAHRAVFCVVNLDDQPKQDALIAIDLNLLQARMRGRLNTRSLRLAQRSQLIEHSVSGGALLFTANMARRSRSTFEVYFEDMATPLSVQAIPEESLPAILGEHNLLKNADFARGDSTPDDWSSNGLLQNSDGVDFGIDTLTSEGAGNRVLRMHVPSSAPTAWRGWRQSVQVQPNRTYLLSAWIKCQGVDDGEARVHLHRRTAQGVLSQHQPMTSISPAISGTTGWTLVSELMRMPEDTTQLEVHLTTNTAGTVWHDQVVVAEVVPAKLVTWQGRPTAEQELAVWPVPSVVKVFPDDPPPAELAEAEISAARSEWEILQLAVRSGRNIDDLRIQAEPPRGPGGKTLDNLEVNIVGLVPIDHPSGYYQSTAPDWQRMIPTQSGQSDGWPGLWPDPLLPTDTTALAANATLSVWVTVKVPASAAAGDYHGVVQLTSGSQSLKQVPYRLHVWDFTLPDQNHVAAIYDVRLGPSAELWGKPLKELYPQIIRFMAQRRLCPDTIQPPPSIHLENGRVVADYREFDKVAAIYFDELKLPFAYTPWMFYLFGWGHPPKEFEEQRPYEGLLTSNDVDRGHLRPAYKQAYQACLRNFWDHLKEKGWQKKIVLYISDEPFEHHPYIRQQMQALCDMIHEVDPAIPIYASTWKHVPDWDGYLNVWGIGNDGRVPIEKMQEMQTAGARIWFTTDGQMCTDTPYGTIERLLPHYCFKYGAEAYEFWGVAWLTYDPFQYGWHAFIRQAGDPGEYYWVRYPNGDGFLLYPGNLVGHDGLVSSIRLEQAREGVEDYEYLWLLKHQIATARAAGRDVAAAQEVLEGANQLVTLPNAGARYSSRILPDPERIYQVRRQIAAAIESLLR